nr:MAG TPA: NTP-PPase-like protein [Caudoviricetes sp.]
MTFEEYQKEAVSYRVGTADNEEYLTLGLIEEVGEAAGKLAKRRRDGVWDEKAFIKELGDILWFVANLLDYRKNEGATQRLKECFLWPFFDTASPTKHLTFLAVQATHLANSPRFYSDSFEHTLRWLCFLVNDFDYTLEQVAEINLAKLHDRAARGQIQGNGDER